MVIKSKLPCSILKWNQISTAPAGIKIEHTFVLPKSTSLLNYLLCQFRYFHHIIKIIIINYIYLSYSSLFIAGIYILHFAASKKWNLCRVQWDVGTIVWQALESIPFYILNVCLCYWKCFCSYEHFIFANSIVDVSEIDRKQPVVMGPEISRATCPIYYVGTLYKVHLQFYTAVSPVSKMHKHYMYTMNSFVLVLGTW